MNCVMKGLRILPWILSSQVQHLNGPWIQANSRRRASRQASNTQSKVLAVVNPILAPHPAGNTIPPMPKKSHALFTQNNKFSVLHPDTSSDSPMALEDSSRPLRSTLINASPSKLQSVPEDLNAAGLAFNVERSPYLHRATNKTLTFPEPSEALSYPIPVQ